MLFRNVSHSSLLPSARSRGGGKSAEGSAPGDRARRRITYRAGERVLSARSIQCVQYPRGLARARACLDRKRRAHAHARARAESTAAASERAGRSRRAPSGPVQYNGRESEDAHARRDDPPRQLAFQTTP